MLARTAATPSARPGRPNLARSVTGRLARTTATEGTNALAPADGEASPATPARPVVARVAQPQAPRHLQLVRSEPPVSEPTIARAAERLASATGGEIEQGEGGLSTVHFPAPGITPQPYTVSREFTDAPATTTSSTSTAPGEQRSDPSNPPATGTQNDKQMEPEELYEYFLDRFRRDLLIEREQLGHLIIDNP
jgi:hypothetical protein